MTSQHLTNALSAAAGCTGDIPDRLTEDPAEDPTNAGDDERCASCTVLLSEARVRDPRNEGVAHWETAHSANLVAFTCGEQCAAELEATRCPDCTRLPNPADSQPCVCTTRTTDEEEASEMTEPVPRGPLTENDVASLNAIAEAARAGRKVRLLTETGDTITGVARHITADDERGAFLGRGDDIRDGFLRVTGAIVDYFWPMTDLVTAHQRGELSLDST